LAAVACPYEDTVRDIVAALDIADGSRWPLTGPGLAFSAHLGPAWFYLLAPVAALSSSWLGIAVFVAALSGLKFPLAFRFGNAIAGRRFGALFALALLLPGWQHLQAMLPTHTSLVETTILACLLSLRAYVLVPTVFRASLVGLTFALALHAHPTALALLALRRSAGVAHVVCGGGGAGQRVAVCAVPRGADPRRLARRCDDVELSRAKFGAEPAHRSAGARQRAALGRPAYADRRARAERGSPGSDRTLGGGPGWHHRGAHWPPTRRSPAL
jgi:hypothetical protein